MSWVIYRLSDSRIYRNRKTGKEYYDSMRTCKAAYTRLSNQGKIDVNEYRCAELDYYRECIERTKVVKNLMSGKEVRISVNTPLCADPSSETYWSM